MNPIIKNNIIGALEDFYRSHCNDEWKHNYGITIETCDNPGWLLTLSDPGVYQSFLTSLNKDGISKLKKCLRVDISCLNDDSNHRCGIQVFGQSLENVMRAAATIIGDSSLNVERH